MTPRRPLRPLLFALAALGASLPARAHDSAAPALRPEDTPAQPADPPAGPPTGASPAASPAASSGTPASDVAPPAAESAPVNPVRPVETWLEGQIELARRGFSGGSIDGVRGPQSAAALRAFQRAAGLEETGVLDQPTRESLLLTAPALTDYVITAAEKASVRPLPATWLGKSEQPALVFASVLELVAERHHASPNFLRRINPDINWDDLLPGVVVKVPAVEHAVVSGHAAQLHLRLAAHELEATDDHGTVIAHFPVSIARNVDKRPVGELHVVVVIPDPNYTFDPEVFPESPEGKELGRKLIIPPGPNNPVGVAWVGLDRTGYGIHGTPDPEKVGRTESHGCFRLANWDARTLLDLAWVGLPVFVEP